MKKRLAFASLMCVLVVSSITAAPGTGGTGTAQEKPERPATDQKPGEAKSGQSADAMFMRTAAMSGMAEVAHGQLATKNASNDEVRKFGQRMVSDHSKANSELKGLASKKQTTLPTELDQKHQAMQDKLSKMKGDEFDRAYMQHMVAAHKEAVTLFEQESKNGKDAETRAWAAKTLPVLREHLKMATAINAKVGKGAKGLH